MDFTSDSLKFLETVQRAFDLAFPNVDFDLSMMDKVSYDHGTLNNPFSLHLNIDKALNKAYDHIKSRKSKLAATILADIKAFFEQPEFAGYPDKICDYVWWALQPGGPAYYAEPIPKDYKVSHKDPAYIVGHLYLTVSRLIMTKRISGSGGLLGISIHCIDRQKIHPLHHQLCSPSAA